MARDFLGLAGNAGGGDVRRRNNSNSNSNAHVMMNHSNNNNNSTSCSSRGGGEMEAGMHGSGRPGVVRPSPVPYQDAGEASAARLRQMGEPTGQQQQHLSSAFGSSNGRSGYRSPPVFNGAVAPGMPGVNSSSIKGSSPLPGGPPPSMPDYLPGEQASMLCCALVMRACVDAKASCQSWRQQSTTGFCCYCSWCPASSLLFVTETMCCLW